MTSKQPAEAELKQQTPKGLEIPVRKRSEIMAAFKKIVRPVKPSR
jgi:hypothetical protein